MKVLITAGGTSESIDSVRKITNTSTGRLGRLISSEFKSRGADVTYITVRSAAAPAHGCNVHYAETAQDVYDTVSRLLKNGSFDVIVHAMAVSDYTVQRVTSLHELFDGFKAAYEAGLASDDILKLLEYGQGVGIPGDVKDTDVWNRAEADTMRITSRTDAGTASIEADRFHRINSQAGDGEASGHGEGQTAGAGEYCNDAGRKALDADEMHVSEPDKQPLPGRGEAGGCLTKLPSGIEDPVIILKPTKKVIGLIKELCPGALLFGFKLLAGADAGTLQRVAGELARKNRCDYIVANDITGISGDRHEAMIISDDGSMLCCATKQDIARSIADIAQKRLG